MLTEEDKLEIQASIAEAEKVTSGEIRIHLDSKGAKDPLEKAKQVFHNLKMDATEEQNGVLIYVSFEKKQIAILGDRGINEKVPHGFWDETYQTMATYFSKKEYKQGLLEGIQLAGKELSTYFPFQKNDTNELSNEITQE